MSEFVMSYITRVIEKEFEKEQFKSIIEDRVIYVDERLKCIKDNMNSKKVEKNIFKFIQFKKWGRDPKNI